MRGKIENQREPEKSTFSNRAVVNVTLRQNPNPAFAEIPLPQGITRNPPKIGREILAV